MPHATQRRSHRWRRPGRPVAVHLLAQAGFAVTVVEQQGAQQLAAPAPDGREIALTHPSVALLQRLGSWQELDAHEVGLLREAQVHDGPVGQSGAMQLPPAAAASITWAGSSPTTRCAAAPGRVQPHARGQADHRRARGQVGITPEQAQLSYTSADRPDAPGHSSCRRGCWWRPDSRFSASGASWALAHP